MRRSPVHPKKLPNSEPEGGLLHPLAVYIRASELTLKARMTMYARIHRPLSLTCALWCLTACAPVPPTPVLIADDGTVIQAPPPPNENQEQLASALADQPRKHGPQAKLGSYKTRAEP